MKVRPRRRPEQGHVYAAWRRLSAQLDGTAGTARLFLTKLLIPQIFVFVLLLGVGAVVLQGVESLLLRLGVLGVLLGVGLFVSSSREFVSYRLVVVYVLGLVALITMTSAVLRVEPLTHVYLPLIGLLAPLVILSLPTPICVFLVAGASLFALAYTPLAMSDWGLGSGVLTGVSGLLLTGGLIVGTASGKKSAHREQRDKTGQRAEPNTPAGRSVSMIAEDRPLQRDLHVLLNRTMLGEFVGEVLWRVVSISLAIGVLVCLMVCTLEHARPSLALSWVALGAIQVALIVQIFQGVDFAKVARTAMLSSVVLVGWWEILVAEPRIVGLLPEAILALIIVSVGPLPWPRRLSFVLCVVFIGAAVVRLLNCPSPPLVILGLAFLCPVVVRVSAVAYVHLAGRVALHFLRRIGEGAPNSLVACRALAWQLSTVAEANRTLLLIGERRVEVLEGVLPRATSVDPVFGRGLFQVLSGRAEDEAVLSFRELTPQFVAPCIDWFGFVPTEFYIVRILGIVDAREEEMFIIVPCTVTARIVGHTRLLRIFGGLTAIVRGWLTAARGRFLSSDVLLASQQSISAREEDLNQLVHLVNNIAQDIFAECDDARHLVRAGSSDTTPFETTVNRVERLVRNLSAGVSDVKLLKELVRVRVLPTRDTVDLHSVIDDVATFGAYRASRSGKPFTVEPGVEAGTRIAVASRDFLAMVLRMLVRLAEARTPAGSEIRLETRLDDQWVSIAVVDHGPPIERERIEREMGRAEDTVAADRSIEIYRAASNLARLSEGRFVFEETERGWAGVLSIRRAAERSGRRIAEGWILLVDDNPQVTTLYARVAEALQRRYFTAASVAEATAIVEREGRPRLVVTDLQLGDGSGIDLVRSLRRRFDDELPIVVVSGNTGADVVEEVRAAGATSYLAKPVGRSKLLSELQALLTV